MVNIQSPTAEIRRGKKRKKEERKRKNKPQHKNIMAPLLHRAAIKITHALVFGGPLRLGALGPGPPGPLVKTALGVATDLTPRAWP